MSLLFTCLALITFIILYYILCCQGVKDKVGKILSSYFFNNFLRFFTEGYLEITFSSFLNIAARPIDSTAEIISLSVSFAVGIPMIVFPFVAGALLYDKSKEIKGGHEQYMKRFGTMYKELRLDREWYLFQYYPIFLVRRLIFVVFLIVMLSYPEMQCN